MNDLAPHPEAPIEWGEIEEPRVPQRLFALKDRDTFLVADSHGTVWDTLFVVRPQGGNVASGRTELTMTMTATARPRRLTTRIMNMLIGPMVRKAVERDMDAVKVFCEK